MLFTYKALDNVGTAREGTVDAQTIESAIEAVESRKYTITSIEPIQDTKSVFDIELTMFERVSNKEIVIFSRQIATLFSAQVSALRIFRLLSAEMGNKKFQRVLIDISDNLQSGNSLSRAFARHPDVFSSFYVSMVKSGEESGTLDSTFMYLADYLDRMYQVISKARNALIYPAFVISIFIVVMLLMLTIVIPSITKILRDSGQEIPIYTKVVMAISDFVSNYFSLIIAFFIFLGIGYWQFEKTQSGKRVLDEMKISIPFLGDLYRKLFLTRVCDNISTMLTSGVSMVQALEVTSEVVDNVIFKEIIENTVVDVKAGRSFSDSISDYKDIPTIMSQMIKVGEETGKLSDILSTLATFYRREVTNSVDTLISLIEPAMIVLLGLGVGTLLASVLIPIYNITGAI